MHPRWFNRSLVALGAMLLVAGCSQLPMSPVDGSMEQQVQSEAQVQSQAPVADQAEAAAGVSSTKRITGLLGGTVAAGDFSVIFPPLSVIGTVTVTVTQPDIDAPVVDLGVAPASANRFRLPVLLIARASRMDRGLLSIAYISCFNPETGRWERVPGCSVSLLNLTVTAPLAHFSRYRVEAEGKAGW